MTVTPCSTSVTPSPVRSYATVATDLTGLAAVAEHNYFSPAVRKRLVIVLTDGESRKVEPRLAATLGRDDVRVLLVHVWQADEGIFITSEREAQYRPDQTSGRRLGEIAALLGGSVFSENAIGAIVDRAREEVGEGPTRSRRQRDPLALMPFATLAAAVPLAVVLRRRNL